MTVLTEQVCRKALDCYDRIERIQKILIPVRSNTDRLIWISNAGFGAQIDRLQFIEMLETSLRDCHRELADMEVGQSY